MNSERFWNVLGQRIGAVTGQRFVARQRQPLGGGCINQAWRVGDGERDFFVKTNSAVVTQTMFEAEAAGLTELAATKTVKVPLPVGHGTAAGLAFLILEYLPLGGGGTQALEMLGHRLAALHRIPQPFFGWHRDN
ncbi:MAG TPA: fructosamine kinase family protein, partial [Candidatus Competibacter sp.]|nr:fructosamine kinase family protein [Candidatus Competibacter sp.]HRW67615.1 fructosamine kinase family protein [Candidatus Competibacter sp.]